MISATGKRPRPNRAWRTPFRKDAGYTLIELILLAVIIAILVGISTPLFRRTFSDLELKDASFNIARIVSFAQEKAIIEDAHYKLILDFDNSRYFLQRSDPKSPGKFKNLEERLGRIFSLPRNVKLKSDKREIIFYPDGHSDKALITLIGEKKLKINIKGVLGRVEIE